MRVGAPGFDSVDSPYPLLGLNGEDPSTQMDPSYATVADNMFIRDGKAFKRPGYTELIADTVADEVMALVDFELLDGTRQFVIVTRKNILRFDDGTSTFVDITPNVLALTAYAITAVDTVLNEFTISGNHASEFTVGGSFDVVGAPHATNSPYRVVSATNDGGDTDIIVTFNITDGTVAGTINTVEILTSIAGDHVETAQATDATGHRLFITNGRDDVMTWDGITARAVLWVDTGGINLPGAPTKIVCRTLAVFFDHLVLGNVIFTGGTTSTKSVFWSDVTDFDEFILGDAGEALLPGLDGPIFTVKTLGDRLAIYSENTIITSTFVGLPVVFTFEAVVEDTRLVSPRAVLDFGPAHLYCTQENIYLFDGSRGIRPVGNKVRTLYKQDLDSESGELFFTFNDIARRFAFIVVPTSSTESVVYVFDYDIFDLRKFRWTRVVFNDRPTAFGFILRRTGARWNDPPNVSWENEGPAIWDDESERIDFPIRTMGTGGSSDQVFLMDEISGIDDTTVITATYESPDFVVPPTNLSHLGRWVEIEADLRGDSVIVSFSTDKGASFTVAETVALAQEPLRYTVPIDILGQTIRVRFQSTLYFELRWIRVWVHEAGL